MKIRLVGVDGRYDSDDYKSLCEWGRRHVNFIRYVKFQGQNDPKHPVSINY